MTEILCKWLNNDVKLTRVVNPVTFAQDFSNGYLIGEILSKHGLQDDFSQFSQSKQAASKVNNFMRLEPTINLLEIEFNTNVAREIMKENREMTTQLLYQMYIALTNKQKRNLTGAAMESMRPAAPVKLEHFETIIYQRQLKAKTPRQTDLDLSALHARYEKFKIEQEAIAFDQKFEDEEKQRQDLQNKRQYLLDKSKKFRIQQAEMAAKIKIYLDQRSEIGDELVEIESPLAAIVQIPKTPPTYTKDALLERRRLFDRNEGENALRDISSFEKRFKTAGSNRENMENEMTIVDLEETRPFEDTTDNQKIDPIEYLKPRSNDDYISKIRNRLQEDAHARKEREKRRRKVLVDQLKANEALEDSKREESLVSHMLRQSQFERRIAVELLHARHEKDVIRENFISKEREIEEKRAKEFYDALEKERELARLAKLEYMDQAQKDKEWHDLIAADRAEAKYKENYEMCKSIVLQIVDLTCKAGEYRGLTDNLIPPKIWRDWISIFRVGLPLYPEDEHKEIEKIEQPVLVDDETMKLLDECDFFEYKNMIGEWEPNDENGITTVPQDNKINGYIINRLHNMCFPIQPGAPAPLFPKFPLKAIVLGKPFSGKTMALQILEKETGIRAINAQNLIAEAIAAYKRNPVLDETQQSQSTELVKEKPSVAQPAVEEKPHVVPPPPEAPTPSKPAKADPKSKNKTPAVVDSKTPKVIEPEPEPEYVPPEDDLMIRRLGEIALTSLNIGEAIKDEIVVHLIIEQIKRLPKDKGWVVDGFPLTYNQAKLLEKGLTGYDDEKPFPVRPKKESILAPNPRPDPPPQKHISSIDLIINLEVENETVLKRSAGRFCGTISQALYHQELKPPPEGSFTGLNKTEIIRPAQDPSNDMEQLQHRITSYEDNWGKVLKFYEKYSKVENLKTDGINEGTLAIEIHRALDDFIEQRERKKREEIDKKIADEISQKEQELLKKQEKEKKKLEEEAAELAKKLEAEKAAQEALERSQTPPKSTKSKKGAKSPAKGEKSPKDKRSQSPAAKGGKKSASPKGKGKKGSTPPPPPEPEVAPAKNEPKPPEPGSEDWVYVNEKLSLLVARILCNHWDVVENSYVENAKFVFRKIRIDREDIIRYFFNIKKDFKEFLRRPDTKQEFVDAFLKMYNGIPDDIRDDEEVKSELHQRVEDLKDQLWSICDKKKEDAEKERETIMHDGWLDDKIGFLNNQYITLMQAEVDRFEDSTRILKDYYKCMLVPMPDEITNEYPRLPLIDLRNEEALNADGQAAATDRTGDSGEKPKSPKSPRNKSPKSPATSAKKPASTNASANKKGKKTPDPVPVAAPGEEPIKEKKHIPLVPRRPDSAQEQLNKKAAAKKPKNPEERSPTPPDDPDEKLVFETHKKALAYINERLLAELALINAEDEGKEPKEDKGAKGPKVGKVVIQKSRTPSAKKGEKPKSPKDKKGKKGEDATPEVQAPVSEEERSKKSIKQKINKEFWAALQKEEQAFKARCDAIKAIAIKTIQDLKTKGDNSYKEMNDWLGSRFMKEIDSIKVLIEVIKHSIENKEKVKQELVLQQEDFFIDTEIVVLRSPTPPRRPDPVEIITPEYFSIDALRVIFAQFELVAPEGLVNVKTFADIYSDLATLNYGTEVLPENWSNLNQTQVESLAKMLSNGSEFVDWRHWLLFASVPWPWPTQSQLLEQLSVYKSIDKDNTGLICRDDFIDTPLWFRLERPPTPTDITMPASYDRFANLLEFWFDLFSEPTENALMINYKNMLLYMSAIADPYEGFLKALSVSQENPMPRLDLKTQMKVSSFNLTIEYDNYRHQTMNEKYPNDQLVSIDSLYRVFHHGERQRGDTHRFAITEDPDDFMSMDRIINIYNELDEDGKTDVLYSKLIAHPVLCEMISNCTKFRSPDFRMIFNMQSSQEDVDFQDRRTPND